MNENNIEYLVGNKECSVIPQIPFNDLVIDFLDDLAKSLMKNSNAKKYSDIVSFAFWCRKSNILKLKQVINISEIRIGKGLVFHITPGNIPVNFAFSFAFSLLAGNSNIVRVSTKQYNQVDIICKAIKQIMDGEKYDKIRRSNAIIRYDHDDLITERLSLKSDVRMIWGGDMTISKIQNIKKSPKCLDITFPNRYSFAIIGSEEILKLNDLEMKQLAEKFYNDTYYNDQNACSSPKLILWKGNKVNLAKERFWQYIFNTAEKYKLEDEKVVEKYMDICRNAIESNNINVVHMNENIIYRVNLKDLSEKVEKFNARFGMFYEYSINEIEEIQSLVTDKYQTITYFGVEKSEIVDCIIKGALTGIDRIVPIGKATDINIVWDGYDLIRTLSRIISVE